MLPRRRKPYKSQLDLNAPILALISLSFLHNYSYLNQFSLSVAIICRLHLSTYIGRDRPQVEVIALCGRAFMRSRGMLAVSDSEAQ